MNKYYKHGILSTDVSRELKVTLKMGYQIKTAIAKRESKIIVENTLQMDEMYI